MSRPTRPISGDDASIQAAGKNASPFVQIGHTGVLQFNGYLFEPLQQELQGQQGRTTLRLMSEQDPTIAGILFAMEMLLRRVQFEPTAHPDDKAHGDEKAEFIGQCLADMSSTFADTLTDILSFLVYGWSYTELTYKRRVSPDSDDPAQRSQYTDGRIGWRKWGIRAQDTLLHWEIDAEGGIQGMWQISPPDYRLVFIPIEKALLFRTSTRRGSPEGYSPLYGCYRPWWFKTKLQTIEAIGAERDLGGLPVIRVPSSVLAANAPADVAATRAAYEKVLRNLRVDEQAGVMLPSDRDETGNYTYDLSLLASPGMKAADVGGMIQRYNNEIAIRLLADFVTLGHESVGSFALSESKTNLFMTAVSAWPEMIASVINQHAIPRLFRLNGISTQYLPTLEPGRLTRTDINEVATSLQLLAQAGLTVGPSPELMGYLLEQMDLPVPTDMLQPYTLQPANPPAVSNDGTGQGDVDELATNTDDPVEGTQTA